jgi:hypothetical protein
VKVNGPTPVDATMSLDAWLDTWLGNKKGTVSEATHADYGARAGDYIRDYLGTKRLHAIGSQDVQSWLNRLRDTGGRRGSALA